MTLYELSVLRSFDRNMAGWLISNEVDGVSMEEFVSYFRSYRGSELWKVLWEELIVRYFEGTPLSTCYLMYEPLKALNQSVIQAVDVTLLSVCVLALCVRYTNAYVDDILSVYPLVACVSE
jgi:hypothetical protein